MTHFTSAMQQMLYLLQYTLQHSASSTAAHLLNVDKSPSCKHCPHDHQAVGVEQKQQQQQQKEH